MSEFEEFPSPLGEPGDLAKLWAVAGASGFIVLGAQRSKHQDSLVTVYGIEEYRELVARMQEVLAEAESMKHLSRHPEAPDPRGEQ